MLQFEEAIHRFPKELVNKLKETQQNPKYHKEGSIYNHIKIVFDKLKDENLKIAALFHDLGKLDATVINKKGEISSYEQDVYAEEYIKKYKHLFPEAKDWKKIIIVCANHMCSHYYKNNELKKAKAEAFEKFPYFNDIMTFERADDYTYNGG